MELGQTNTQVICITIKRNLNRKRVQQLIEKILFKIPQRLINHDLEENELTDVPAELGKLNSYARKCNINKVLVSLYDKYLLGLGINHVLNEPVARCYTNTLDAAILFD